MQATFSHLFAAAKITGTTAFVVILQPLDCLAGKHMENAWQLCFGNITMSVSINQHESVQDCDGPTGLWLQQTRQPSPSCQLL